MNTMTTLSERLLQLKEEGYTEDFNLQNHCLVCRGNALELHPADFVVDKHYRFEGESDPDDAAVLYAISSARHQLKGVLVNGYGIYSDPATDDMVKALQPRPQ